MRAVLRRVDGLRRPKPASSDDAARTRCGMKRAAIFVLVFTAIVVLAVKLGNQAPFKSGQVPDNGAATDPIDDPAERTEVSTSSDETIQQLHFNRPSDMTSGGNFACTIDEILDARHRNPDDEASIRSRATLVDILSASNIGEHVFVASLLNGDTEPDRRRMLMEQALQLAPSNPVIGLWATEMCRSSRWAGLCDRPDERPVVTTVLANNGAYWASVAANRDQAGDSAGALLALRQATTAPQFDSYSVELAVLVSQSLAAANDMGYVERIGQALGYVAAMPMSSASLYKSCKEYAAESPAWLDTCIEYAARQAGDARTVFGKLIGLRLHRELLEAAGNRQRAAEVSARYADLKQQFNASWDNDMAVVFTTDAKFVAQYIDEFLAGDEFTALDFATAELQRLKADPDYDPCVLAGVSGDRP